MQRSVCRRHGADTDNSVSAVVRFCKSEWKDECSTLFFVSTGGQTLCPVDATRDRAGSSRVCLEFRLHKRPCNGPLMPIPAFPGILSIWGVESPERARNSRIGAKNFKKARRVVHVHENVHFWPRTVSSWPE